jgi:tetratricopeptide (TPR) repeat protein
MQYAAVRLFVERAAAAKSDFTLTGANAPAVAQICYRLDGIPLAIELAAARIKVFSAEQIAARLTDRFRLLTGGSRTALPRQQTLRGAIDWSYSLLSEPERSMLRRVSVFAGGWSYEAAESVCSDDAGAVREPPLLPAADILDLLTRLVEKSLVAEAEKDGEARYRMLETIRQYARDKLLESGEGERVRALHLKFYVGFAEQFAPEAFGPRMVWWLAPLETELDNMRAGLEWSLEMHDALSGMRLAGALMGFWQLRHPVEGLAYLHAILSQPEAAVRGLPRAGALRCQGFIEYWQGNYASAQASFEEAIPIANEAGDAQMKANLLLLLGWTRAALKDYVSARAYLTEALGTYGLAGDPFEVAAALSSLADVAMSEGQLDEAKALYEQSVEGLRLLRNIGTISIPLRRLGQIALQLSEIERAATYIEESLTLNLQQGDRRGIAACRAAWAAMLVAQGRTLDAVRLYGAARTLLESYQTKMMPIDQDRYERSVAALRAQFGAATFDAAESAGRLLTMEQAVALAIKNGDA